MNYNLTKLEDKCRELRRSVLVMLENAGSGHSGGSLSMVEIMVALYYCVMNNAVPNPEGEHDHFILSKGHAAPALYAVLADKGFFPVEELKTLRKLHSRLQGHPDSKKLPGVEISTGSLGQGISVAAGMALAIKTKKENERVFTVIGDGESEEGLVWEAAEFAAHYKLDNFFVIVDRNRLQLDGPCEKIMNNGDLAAKFKAFGFKVSEVEGNNLHSVIEALTSPVEIDKPNCIIADTVKGKGVSFMENQVGWHGKSPNKKELELALEELGGNR